jgi:uncharacterized protein (TIGR03118 family)
MSTKALDGRTACGICLGVGASVLLAVFSACSSSSTSPSAGVSSPNATPMDNWGGSDLVPDAGVGDAGAGHATDIDACPVPDSGAILQIVAETALFADTTDVTDADVPTIDPNLVNAWGLAFSPSGTAWVANNGAGVAALYGTGSAAPVGVVQVPVPDGGGGGSYPALDSGTTSTPTGQIFNVQATAPDAGTTGDFLGDAFIISAEDGAISGWAPTQSDTTKATLRVDLSSNGASFTGLAIVPASPPLLLAADFHNGKIDVFDANYAPVTPAAGKWIDSTVPSGYAPFNVYAFGARVFVAYALQDGARKSDSAGVGHGAVSVFDFTGTLVASLVAQSVDNGLNSPWGLTTVPESGWGKLSPGTLLVGNFGDGSINAFDPTSGALLANFVSSWGAPFLIDGLRALAWGPSAPDAGSSPGHLYFTAAPNKTSDGLYGYLVAQ